MRMAQESEIKPRRLQLDEVAADCYFVSRQMYRHADKIRAWFFYTLLKLDELFDLLFEILL